MSGISDIIGDLETINGSISIEEYSAILHKHITDKTILENLIKDAKNIIIIYKNYSIPILHMFQSIIASLSYRMRTMAKKYIITKNLTEQLLITKLNGLLAADLIPPFEFVEYEIPITTIVKQECLTLMKNYFKLNNSIKVYAIKDINNRLHIMLPVLINGLISPIGYLYVQLDDQKFIYSNDLPFYDRGTTKSEYVLDPEREIYANLDKIYDLAMNAIVYSTHIETRALLHNQEQIEKAENKTKKLTGAKKSNMQKKLNILRLSSKIVLGSNVKALPTQEEITQKTLVLVQGHWRNQVCGPRNTLRKIIWIEPFWRGELATDGDKIRVMN